MKILIAFFGISLALDDCSRGIFNNRILDGGVCKACPLGIYGMNCTAICPTGFFGHECTRECNCSRGQFCHPSYGCGILMKNGAFHIHEEEKRSRKQKSCTKAITLSSTLSGGVVLLLVLLFTTCKRRFINRIRLKKELEILTTMGLSVSNQRNYQEQDIAESRRDSSRRASYAEMESVTEIPEMSYRYSTSHLEHQNRSDYVSMNVQRTSGNAGKQILNTAVSK